MLPCPILLHTNTIDHIQNIFFPGWLKIFSLNVRIVLTARNDDAPIRFLYLKVGDGHPANLIGSDRSFLL